VPMGVQKVGMAAMRVEGNGTTVAEDTKRGQTLSLFVALCLGVPAILPVICAVLASMPIDRIACRGYNRTADLEPRIGGQP